MQSKVIMCLLSVFILSLSSNALASILRFAQDDMASQDYIYNLSGFNFG